MEVVLHSNDSLLLSGALYFVAMILTCQKLVNIYYMVHNDFTLRLMQMTLMSPVWISYTYDLNSKWFDFLPGKMTSNVCKGLKVKSRLWFASQRWQSYNILAGHMRGNYNYAVNSQQGTFSHGYACLYPCSFPTNLSQLLILDQHWWKPDYPAYIQKWVWSMILQIPTFPGNISRTLLNLR